MLTCSAACVGHQVDLQLESGEYFLNEQQRKAKKKAEKAAKAAEQVAKKKKEREVRDQRPRSSTVRVVGCT